MLKARPEREIKIEYSIEKLFLSVRIKPSDRGGWVGRISFVSTKIP